MSSLSENLANGHLRGGLGFKEKLRSALLGLYECFGLAVIVPPYFLITVALL